MELTPVIVYDLAVDLKSGFSTRRTYVFVGDVPANVAAELDKLSDTLPEKNKTLEQYYGSAWVNVLGLGKSGGDDIFDLPDQIKPPKDEISTYLDKIKAKTPDTSKQSVVFVRNVHIYPEDRISEFREKLYLATVSNKHPVPIYKQHLFAQVSAGERTTSIPIRYRIIADGSVNVNIRNIFSGGNKILGIPVDNNLWQNRDIVQVEALDYFTTISELYERFGVRTYYMISIDDFMVDAQLIRDIATSDQYQFQLLYWGFVIKYFPMMSFDVFKLYCINEADIKQSYPDLMPNIQLLQAKYDAEKKILDYKYELLRNPPPDFKRYNPDLVKFDGTPEPGIVSVSVKSATLSNFLTEEQDISSKIKINIRNLFELFPASGDVSIIKTKLLVSSKLVTLTKVLNTGVDIQKVLEKTKHRLQIPYYNTLLFVVRIPEAQDNESYLVFTIYDNGKYNVRSIWEEEIQMDFRKVYALITDTINPIINRINTYGRSIFESIKLLSPISRINTEFTSLNINLFWKIPMSRRDFDQIAEMIKEETTSQIIRPEHDEVESGSYAYYINKGITEYDIRLLEKNMTVFNYYEYLSDARIKQRWAALFEKGRLMTITHRTTDIRAEVAGLKEKEFTDFYLYFISFLYRAEKRISALKESGKMKRLEITASNVLKVLKSRDPELYVFKRYGSDIVFSRICQKEHQPIPYLPEEYDSLDGTTKGKAVKYWNFTTKSPMYYVCPNKNFPHLNFLVGHHPKGYCIPCCKKNIPYEYELTDHTDLTKKEYIYNVCMQQHTYSEKDIQGGPSRYIMNYGKPIDIGRIGRLPDIIDRYLLYNLEDKEILESIDQTITRDFGSGPQTYMISLLWKLTKANKIFEESADDYKVFLEDKAWSGKEEQFNAIEIINNPGLSHEHYNRISNADLTYPIIVFDNKGKRYVMDGIHRIAKTILESKLGESTQIKVRYITKKQLDRAIVQQHGGADINITNIKRPGYYLYGVPQNNASISNIGAGFAIAVALNIPFPEYIHKIVTFLTANKEVDYFKILLNGKLERYFSGIDQLITTMVEILLSEKSISPLTTRFFLWNELFIDLTKIVFGKYVIVFDDISVDIIGTSIKSSRISENINLVLPIKVTNVDDIVPLETTNIMEYILLFRRKKKNRSFFGSSKLYYPIFIFIPQIFFKTLNIEKKIFNYNDEIMRLVRDLVVSALSETSDQLSFQQEMDIKVILKFVDWLRSNKRSCCIKILSNSRNLGYAVLLDLDKKTYYMPIKYSPFDNIPGTYFTADHARQLEPFSRASINTTYIDVKELAEEYNTFVVEESERLGYFRIMETTAKRNKLNQREAKILPVYPLIKISKLLMIPGPIVIGFESSGLFYYFSDVTITRAKLEKLHDDLTSGYDLFAGDVDFAGLNKSIRLLQHDPDLVNKNIRSTAPSEFKSVELHKAVYDHYIYYLFVSEFMNDIDMDRDPKLREELFDLVNKTNFKGSSMEAFRVSLNALLVDFPDDVVRVQDHVNRYTTSHFNKKTLLKELNEIIYYFDRTTLIKLEELSNDYYKNPDPVRKEQRNKLRQFIEKRSRRIVELGTPDFNGSFSNILASCSSGESNVYCRKSKLIIDEAMFSDMIEIFIDDIVNPIKRQYFLSSILLTNIRNYFQFGKKKDEEIYITTE